MDWYSSFTSLAKDYIHKFYLTSELNLTDVQKMNLIEKSKRWTRHEGVGIGTLVMAQGTNINIALVVIVMWIKFIHPWSLVIFGIRSKYEAIRTAYAQDEWSLSISIEETFGGVLFLTMIFTMYKGPKDAYRNTTLSKVLMPPRHKEPPEVKEKENTLKGTGKRTLNRNERIHLSSCSKKWGLLWTGRVNLSNSMFLVNRQR